MSTRTDSLSHLLGSNALSPSTVASQCLSDGSQIAKDTQISQTTHRLDVLRSWLEADQVTPSDATQLLSNLLRSTGASLLDIGCGQGDMTALLASLCSEIGGDARVIGIDPARSDYGSPYTLGQAQAHLLSSPKLSAHLSFVQATAPEHLTTISRPYTAALLVHSLYYFPSAASLYSTLASLRSAGTKRLLLAEWSLSTSRPSSIPHVLAVLLQSVAPIEEGNVRTVLAPSTILALARSAGWELVSERTFEPAQHVADGRWEVGFAKGVAKRVREKWEKSLGEGEGEAQGDDRTPSGIRDASIRAHGAALESALSTLGSVRDVTSMDVWTAVLKPASP